MPEIKEPVDGRSKDTRGEEQNSVCDSANKASPTKYTPTRDLIRDLRGSRMIERSQITLSSFSCDIDPGWPVNNRCCRRCCCDLQSTRGDPRQSGFCFSVGDAEWQWFLPLARLSTIKDYKGDPTRIVKLFLRIFNPEKRISLALFVKTEAYFFLLFGYSLEKSAFCSV